MNILKHIEKMDELQRELSEMMTQFLEIPNENLNTKSEADNSSSAVLELSKIDTDGLDTVSESFDLEDYSSSSEEKSFSEKSVHFEEPLYHTSAAVESKNHSRQIKSRLGNSRQKKKKNVVMRSFNRLLSLLDCFSVNEGVLVPYHYPGNTTPPRLVTSRPRIINKQLETLRIISSAAEVSIKTSDSSRWNILSLEIPKKIGRFLEGRSIKAEE